MTTTSPKIKAYYGPGGALVTDRPVEGVTHELNDETARYYGSKHFIAESMTRKAAVAIAVALGLELVDAPFVEPRKGSPLQGQEGEKAA